MEIVWPFNHAKKVEQYQKKLFWFDFKFLANKNMFFFGNRIALLDGFRWKLVKI